MNEAEPQALAFMRRALECYRMALPAQTVTVGLHTARLEARRLHLGAVFNTVAMQKVWRNYVRDGLRRQDVLDLFDYNDFHWNRDAKFTYLAQAISDGRYVPSPSTAVRSEKKNGICRISVIPSPEDAVVLQCIVESILPAALAKQPSKNTFFSRSHASPQAAFNYGFDYIWFKKWRKFSGQRIELASTHDYIVTTDVANFFDSIRLTQLRNVVSSCVNVDESVLDILFLALEAVSWRPDYLPNPGIGLPQVNFDAPRLLAHMYMFEADEFIKRCSNNTFIRWVDDITVGLDTVSDCKLMLRDLDALMQLRGIRLNTGKTKILSASEAREYFCATANARFGAIDGEIILRSAVGKPYKRLINSAVREFLRESKVERVGHHDKVLKRYIGLFAKHQEIRPLDTCLKLFETEPALRPTILRYIEALGPSRECYKVLYNYLSGPDVMDDVSVFSIGVVLTRWEVKPGSALFRDLGNLGASMMSGPLRKSHFFFLAGLWLSCKYTAQKRFAELLVDTELFWLSSDFLTRQVAAATAKFRNPSRFQYFHSRIEKRALPSAFEVLAALRRLHTLTAITPDIRLYMLNGNNKGVYGLQRFLCCHWVLSSKALPRGAKSALKKEVLTMVGDPHYKRVLNRIKL